MFLEKYLNNTYLYLLYDKYEELYINQLNEKNFTKIYKLFEEYGFDFIEDIILHYLEIFEYEKEDVEDGILKLRKKLGENFVYIISNNLSYLEEISSINMIND